MFKKYFLLDVIRLGDAVRLCLGQAIDLDPMRRSKAEQASYKDMVDSYGREFIRRHLYKTDHVITPVRNTENSRVSFYKWVEFLQSMEVTLPPPLLDAFRLQDPKDTSPPPTTPAPSDRPTVKKPIADAAEIIRFGKLVGIDVLALPDLTAGNRESPKARLRHRMIEEKVMDEHRFNRAWQQILRDKKDALGNS